MPHWIPRFPFITYANLQYLIQVLFLLPNNNWRKVQYGISNALTVLNAIGHLIQHWLMMDLIEKSIAGKSYFPSFSNLCTNSFRLFVFSPSISRSCYAKLFGPKGKNFYFFPILVKFLLGSNILLIFLCRFRLWPFTNFGFSQWRIYY